MKNSVKDIYFTKLNLFFFLIIIFKYFNKNNRIYVFKYKNTSFLFKIITFFFKKINIVKKIEITDKLFFKVVYKDFNLISDNILGNRNENKDYLYYYNNLIFEINNKDNLYRNLIFLNYVINNSTNKKIIYLKNSEYKSILKKFYAKKIKLKSTISIISLIERNIKNIFKVIIKLLFFKLISNNIYKKSNIKKNNILFDNVNENLFKLGLWLNNYDNKKIFFLASNNDNNIKNNNILNKYNIFYFNKYFIEYKIFSIIKNLNNIIYKKYFLNFFIDQSKFNYYFKKYSIKFFITNSRFDFRTIAGISSIKNFNGISIFYQTTFNINYPSYGKFTSDIFFASSLQFINKEFSNGTLCKYNIVTGYIDDHMFIKHKKASNRIRSKFCNTPDIKIITFFDNGFNNNLSDFLNSKYLNHLYEFFLDKIIENEWLCMIFKPKLDNSIFKINDGNILFNTKFSNLNPKLKTAISLKRLQIFVDLDNPSVKNRKNFPSQVALASDLVVNSMLYSCTAAIESALCDIPTIIYNNIDNYDSDIIATNKENIIFNDLDILWNKVNELFFKNNNNVGNWSQFINNIDPFRDGNALNRCINLIDNIDANLKKGLKKEIAIENAIKIYKNKFGEDKVITR